MPKDFDDLLAQMPAIAKAVNQFESDEVQRAAFSALVGAFDSSAASPADEAGSRDTPKTPAKKSTGTKAPRKTSGTKKADGKKTARKRSGAEQVPHIVKDLNLRPPGKKSFKDFADEKGPTNFNQKNTVAVYYLRELLGITDVTVDHVFSCYKEAGWRTPAMPLNNLRVTASQKGWLDTSDTTDIKISIPGRNFVEHDLPATPS